MTRETGTTTRRTFLAGAAGAVGAALAACAPAAAPSAPTGGPSGGLAPWEKEWEQLIEAAKKEGKLGIFTLAGSGYRDAVAEFEKVFGIQVEHQAENSSSIWVPKFQKEREAGLYSMDVFVVPPNSALIRLKPSGAWDPIRPLIFRPDVLDDKVWPQGFDNEFMDVEKKLAFGYSLEVNRNVAVDTNQVHPDEIKSIEDLLKPKWKGKILITDVRSGSTWLSASSTRSQKPNADELLTKLLVEQQPDFIRDDRQKAEAVVRGRYPIVLGIVYATMTEFVRQGVANHVKFLDVPDMDYIVSYTALLYNKAPHPNAAKLFVNWFLSKEGQKTWCSRIPINSARTDLEPFDLPLAPARGARYYFASRESEYTKQQATQEWIAKTIGIDLGAR